ncbi:MAG: hypothetical protein JWO42_2825, partial [Chloroflexi bacterium]|nr:hypothetical protein [Chloroflexota bacterium]
ARLFRDLMDGTDEGDDVVKRRAALLGCDLGRPHAPVVLSLAVDSSPAARRAALLRVLPLAQRWLGEKFPGSLIHLEAELWLVVRVRGEAPLEPLLSELSALHGLLVRELGGLTCVGVGRICRALIDYRQGFEQAQEALRVARSTRAPDGVAAFDRLGAARYLAGLAAESPTETPQDRFQQAIEELSMHDARRASGLLETLTAFLAAGGNIARTAERLYVHRNTLVQRLDKIQDLTGLDPRESDHWLALQIVLTLRQLQREG